MFDSETIPNVIKCCLCANESSTVKELEDHISTWHINLYDRFQCEQCLTQQKQAKFSTEANLKSHMDQEHGIRQFWFRTWSSPETIENSAKICQLVEQSLDCSRRGVPLPDQSQPMDEIVPETPPISPRSTHNPRDYSLDPCMTFCNAKIEVEINVNEMDTKDGITDRSVRSADGLIPVINISNSDNEGEENISDQHVCATKSKESQEPASEMILNSQRMTIVSEQDQEANRSDSQTVHIPRPMAKKSVNTKTAHSMIHRIRTARSVVSRDKQNSEENCLEKRTGLIKRSSMKRVLIALAMMINATNANIVHIRATLICTSLCICARTPMRNLTSASNAPSLVPTVTVSNHTFALILVKDHSNVISVTSLVSRRAV